MSSDLLCLLCVYCARYQEEHLANKCLFGPMCFRPLEPMEMFNWLTAFDSYLPIVPVPRRTITSIELLERNDTRREPAIRIVSRRSLGLGPFISILTKPSKNRWGMWAYPTFVEYADSVLGKTEAWHRWEWH